MSGVYVPLTIPPGIIKDLTEYAADGRWSDGNLVRFKEGMPEKIKGWLKDTVLSVIQGVPRSMLIWRDLSENDIIAVGTHSHLYAIYQGVLADITPLRATSTNVASPPFSVTSGSAVVVVTDASHGATDLDWVTIGSAAAVGGITPDGTYEISAVTTNTYEITHSSAATSTTTGGGAATDIEYNITTGTADTTTGLGWGAGAWNVSTWGSARAAGSTTASVELTLWSLDLWGEDLVATVRSGGTYVWDTSVGTGTRAAAMSNAPTTAKLSGVTEDRHVTAYGAHDGSVDDPMFIRWCDQEDYTAWTPSATNTAGNYRLTKGTRIISAVETRRQVIIFTDAALYSQLFTGPPYTYRFDPLATEINLIGPKATAEVNDSVYWMDNHDFKFYNGQVNVIPSPVRRYVFDNINPDAREKCFIAVNKQFKELWFFYPRGTATECSHYAAFYYLEPQKNIWHIGEMARSTWHDKGKFLNNPIALDSDGNYYAHETGEDNDLVAMTPYIESGAMELNTPEGAGGRLMLMDKFVPDATASDDMELTVYVRKYPNATEVTKGPFTITPTTTKKSLRAKGRQTRVRYASSTAGVSWTVGRPRARIKPTSGV